MSVTAKRATFRRTDLVAFRGWWLRDHFPTVREVVLARATHKWWLALNVEHSLDDDDVEAAWSKAQEDLLGNWLPKMKNVVRCLEEDDAGVGLAAHHAVSRMNEYLGGWRAGALALPGNVLMDMVSEAERKDAERPGRYSVPSGWARDATDVERVALGTDDHLSAVVEDTYPSVSLSDGEARIVYLRAVEELPWPEIAHHEGLSERQVRRVHDRGMDRLRHGFGDDPRDRAWLN